MVAFRPSFILVFRIGIDVRAFWTAGGVSAFFDSIGDAGRRHAACGLAPRRMPVFAWGFGEALLVLDELFVLLPGRNEVVGGAVEHLSEDLGLHDGHVRPRAKQRQMEREQALLTVRGEDSAEVRDLKGVLHTCLSEVDLLTADWFYRDRATAGR